MKKFFLAGLCAILFAALSLIGYGAYLNQSGESNMTARMEERAIPLMGEKVKERYLTPKITLDTINLYSPEMADAVALVDGRVENIYVSKNQTVAEGDTLALLVNEELPIKVKQAESSILILVFK